MQDGTSPDQEGLRSDLRAKVAKLVETGMKERKLRIARLEKSIGDERERLATDEKNRDAVIDERMRRSVEEGNNP